MTSTTDIIRPSFARSDPSFARSDPSFARSDAAVENTEMPQTKHTLGVHGATQRKAHARTDPSRDDKLSRADTHGEDNEEDQKLGRGKIVILILAAVAVALIFALLWYILAGKKTNTNVAPGVVHPPGPSHYDSRDIEPLSEPSCEGASNSSINSDGAGAKTGTGDNTVTNANTGTGVNTVTNAKPSVPKKQVKWSDATSGEPPDLQKITDDDEINKYIDDDISSSDSSE